MSRQSLSAIESGLSDPSLRNALALAHVLDVAVEELFEQASSARSVMVKPVAPLGSRGARVALALMGDDLKMITTTPVRLRNCCLKVAR